MELYIYLIVALFMVLSLALIDEFFWPRKSPDTFPDNKFLATWKRYSTPEIAKALDEIGEGI